MEENGGGNLFELFCGMIEAFDPCMDDYLYVFDVQNDQYYISKKSMKRFALPSFQFTHVLDTHRKFVYEEDIEMLEADLEKVMSGENLEHNLTYRWMSVDGEPIWINCRGRIIIGADGKPQFLVGCINEVGTKPIADNVSGLLESFAIKDAWNQQHNTMTNGFVLRIGIDNFKTINEKLGVEYGDFIIHEVANCILDCIHEGQMVFRVVADEFLIIDTAGGTAKDAKALYRKVRNGVDHLISRDNYKAFFTISGGVISGETLGQVDYNELLKYTQFALSEAKARGKNQVYYFQVEDYEKFLRRRKILVELRKAVSNDFEGFDVFFQPIITRGGKDLYAAESLLRFWTSEKETVSPAEFIPILEESGLIIPVGKWVLHRALEMCVKCREKRPDFKVSVNLSYIQILKSNFFKDVTEALEQYKLRPDSLIIELTESGYVENSPVVRKLWEQLKDRGVLIAIDDFGTGYSNLQSIGNMMPDIIKLDRGFTVKALNNNYEHQLMNQIIQLIHSVDLKVCVEGVETMEELTEIERLSADCIQGYYYGKPCEKQAFYKDFVEK
ncbi:MAG: GGDEF and EAL domain-containing protein [Agathobacter sp.]|nr:GGDEF and EAL domain-containing protein [Agathobacter sp.]